MWDKRTQGQFFLSSLQLFLTSWSWLYNCICISRK